MKISCSKELSARAGLETGKLLWYYTKNTRQARIYLEYAVSLSFSEYSSNWVLSSVQEVQGIRRQPRNNDCSSSNHMHDWRDLFGRETIRTHQERAERRG